MGLERIRESRSHARRFSQDNHGSPAIDRSIVITFGTGNREKRGEKEDSCEVLVDGHQCIPGSGKGWFCQEASIVSRRWPVIVYGIFHDHFPMRGTNHTIIVIIVIVITFYLLRPRYRSASSEKKCQTVILPRVIEKSSCDPCFTSPYSVSLLHPVHSFLPLMSFLSERCALCCVKTKIIISEKENSSLWELKIDPLDTRIHFVLSFFLFLSTQFLYSIESSSNWRI